MRYQITVQACGPTYPGLTQEADQAVGRVIEAASEDEALEIAGRDLQDWLTDHTAHNTTGVDALVTDVYRLD